jgi:hypothetical protein
MRDRAGIFSHMCMRVFIAALAMCPATALAEGNPNETPIVISELDMVRADLRDDLQTLLTEATIRAATVREVDQGDQIYHVSIERGSIEPCIAKGTLSRVMDRKVEKGDLADSQHPWSSNPSPERFVIGFRAPKP